MKNTKNTVICLGEQHEEGHSVYEALNQMSSEELSNFIKNNNIKDVFFEFIPAKDFPLQYIPNQGLILDIDIGNKTMIGRKAITAKDEELMKDKYKQINTFGALLEKVGSFKEAIDLIQKIAFNTASFYKLKSWKIGHLADGFTRTQQLNLIEKLKKLGCKIHGLEDLQSFQSIIGGVNDNLDRIENLNNTANKIINTELKNKQGNALCVMGNGHFVNYTNSKKVISTQDLLKQSDFETKTILLIDEDTAKLYKNYIEQLEQYYNINEFNANCIANGQQLSLQNIDNNNVDNKSRLEPVKQTTIELTLHYKKFLDKAKNEGSFTERMKLRNDIEQPKPLNQEQIYQLGKLDLTTWMKGFEEAYKKGGDDKKRSSLSEKLSNPNLHLNDIFNSSRLKNLATYFENDKDLFQSLKDYTLQYIKNPNQEEVEKAKNNVMESLKNAKQSKNKNTSVSFQKI
jgi:hypothetical protein